MLKKYLVDKWEYLRGSINEFSFENRMVNSICAITFLMVFVLMIFNFVASLLEEAFITMAILMLNVYVYYLSRFLKKYKDATIIYASASYIALIFVYYYNGGISGPALFFFFLSFQVIVTVTSQRNHIYWAFAHVFTVSLLCYLEYRHPGLFPSSYPDRGTRYADVGFSFVMSLLFVYMITMQLRINMDRNRSKAIERAETIEKHLEEIKQQNEKLKEISWLQSHKVRSQVATILGLSQFVNQANIEDPDLNRVINGIKEAAKDLDDVIREINRLTNNADINK
jgi:hypothetical protein